MSIKVNGNHIQGFTFPGGERHVNVNDIPDSITYNVEAKIKSSDDLMDMVLTCDALYRKREYIPINLLIPYLPYSRQDRVCSHGDPFSLNSIARMLNTLIVKQVVVFDPHNYKQCSQYINNFRVITNDIFVNNIIQHKNPDFLVCPDNGARNKYHHIWNKLPTVFCSKKRDPSTGKLSGFEITEVPENFDDNFKYGLIVDDICDGGGTFIGISSLFPDKELSLAVSHGIFSNGYFELLKCFKNIFTTDSYFDQGKPIPENIRVYNWCPYYG